MLSKFTGDLKTFNENIKSMKVRITEAKKVMKDMEDNQIKIKQAIRGVDLEVPEEVPVEEPKPKEIKAEAQ